MARALVNQVNIRSCAARNCTEGEGGSIFLPHPSLRREGTLLEAMPGGDKDTTTEVPKKKGWEKKPDEIRTPKMVKSPPLDLTRGWGKLLNNSRKERAT